MLFFKAASALKSGVIRDFMSPVTTVEVSALHAALGVADPVVLPSAWHDVPLVHWKMDADDLILRQVIRQVRPLRYLEFGTWLGDGVLRCVEECDATVWTINVLHGETKPNGQWAYGELENDPRSASVSPMRRLPPSHTPRMSPA